MFRQISHNLIPFIKPTQAARLLCTASTSTSEGEKRLAEKLMKHFSPGSQVKVVDVSGGCGSMYQIQVTSSDFKGKLKVQQHRMVNDAIRDDIKSMHGLVIDTKPA
uniref:BolA-like protein 3 n=1 Tax=Acrobeloides nanus TaxID=290746 RepID=A0A914CG83_9BILA